MIPPHLPGNRNPPQTDRQTGPGGGETLPPSRFSPLCPHLKRKSNTDYAAPQPPTHPSSVCGTPSPARGSPETASRRSPSLWFAPGSSVPSSSLSLRPSYPYIFYHLLGPSLWSLGPPAPGLLGKQHLLPARGSARPSLPKTRGSHGRPTLLEVRG